MAYLIIPIFAIANAGVAIGDASLTGSVSLGVVVGLVLGKPIGITLATAAVLRIGFGTLPVGMRFVHVPALAALAGIGFTMSLFISELAFSSESLINEAKIGILAASLIAAVLGSLAIRFTMRSSVAERTVLGGYIAK